MEGWENVGMRNVLTLGFPSGNVVSCKIKIPIYGIVTKKTSHGCWINLQSKVKKTLIKNFMNVKEVSNKLD